MSAIALELRAVAESDVAYMWKGWCEEFHGADNIPLNVVNAFIGPTDGDDEEPEGRNSGS